MCHWRNTIYYCSDCPNGRETVVRTQEDLVDSCDDEPNCQTVWSEKRVKLSKGSGPSCASCNEARRKRRSRESSARHLAKPGNREAKSINSKAVRAARSDDQRLADNGAQAQRRKRRAAIDPVREEIIFANHRIRQAALTQAIQQSQSSPSYPPAPPSIASSTASSDAPYCATSGNNRIASTVSYSASDRTASISSYQSSIYETVENSRRASIATTQSGCSTTGASTTTASDRTGPEDDQYQDAIFVPRHLASQYDTLPHRTLEYRPAPERRHRHPQAQDQRDGSFINPGELGFVYTDAYGNYNTIDEYGNHVPWN